MGVIARLLIKGFIQGIGYRAYVKQSAYRLKVKGAVKNMHDGSVEIYCNAPDEETYNNFKDMLKSGVGEIEEIEEYFEGSDSYGEGPGEWIGFNFVRDEYGGAEEILEYVVLGGVQLKGEVHELGNKEDSMLEKQDNMLEKKDNMLEKQDNMLEKQDNMLEKQDNMLEKQDQTLTAIKDMDQHMNDKFDWLADR